jgi:hypothetical protein
LRRARCVRRHGGLHELVGALAAALTGRDVVGVDVARIEAVLRAVAVRVGLGMAATADPRILLRRVELAVIDAVFETVAIAVEGDLAVLAVLVEIGRQDACRQRGLATRRACRAPATDDRGRRAELHLRTRVEDHVLREVEALVGARHRAQREGRRRGDDRAVEERLHGDRSRAEVGDEQIRVRSAERLEDAAKRE